MDQNYLAPVKDGSFKGGVYVYGIKEGGIDYAPSTSKKVPPEVLAKVDRLKQMIVDGKIAPPRTYEELASFITPTLQ